MDINDLNEISKNLLHLSYSLHRTIFNNNELNKGLTIPPSHVAVIFCLEYYGSLSISEIAKKLNIYKPNMTPILDKLIQEGFVIRCEDSKDRRILRIELTEKAHEFIKLQRNKLENIVRNKISHLSEDDFQNLSNSLLNINSIVSKLK